MITHDEAKEAQSRLFDSYIYGDFIPFPTRSDLDIIKQYITQQEQVEKDVARYFELGKQYLEIMFDDETSNEIKVKLDDLYEKLTKGVAK